MSIFKTIFQKKEQSPFTQRQKELVQGTFMVVVPISDKAAEIFYNRLFLLDPSLRGLFRGGEMKSQGQKLMAMLAAAVKGLDDLPALVPVVQDLGKRHGNYGVKEAHYDTVAAALLYTLEAGLGDMWTDEVKDAWVAIYTVLATTMKDAAHDA